ncbi:MAG TPA: hypothetical protein VK021_06200 [Flavobacteriaceae bacterium]|nr:hypothetical protein [Flavobacteriaceae bacterium]
MLNKKHLKFTFGFLILAVLVLTGSCRKDFDTEPSDGELRFSKDTVYLDTVFTNVGSSTYRVTVYNDSKNDITIPQINLNRGENSKYRLNVDGIPGKSFNDIDILAKDSIFVFVETTADIEDLTATDTQFLYTDQIEFDVGIHQQKIELITLVQDAHFLFPEKYDDGTTEMLTFGPDEDGEYTEIYGFYLSDDELHFTADKPYVIYGYAAVPPDKTLTIDPGARIHFHQNGGLLVANQGSLHVNGELSNDLEAMENEVIFQGDRLEPEYNTTPGQWQTIWLTEGSTNNIINHATIKNATAGLKIDSNDGSVSPTLEISNTKIFNCSTVGLWATTSHIKGENLAINRCGQASLFLSLGGKYNFYNSTFANYWDIGYRDFPTVLISNQLETPETIFVADLEEANFYNSIIYGNNNLELLFDKVDQADFNFKFENSLIKFNDYTNLYQDHPLYDFENPDLYQDNIFNQEPLFLDSAKNQLNISLESPASELGNPNTATPTDILGRNRGSFPSSGAYEAEEFPEEE